MTVNQLAEKYNMQVLSEGSTFSSEFKGCFSGDLLSLARSGVTQSDVWVTVQTNLNILGIAALTEAACIIVANNMTVQDEIIKRAKEEDICLLRSEKTAFELCCLIGEQL